MKTVDFIFHMAKTKMSSTDGQQMLIELTKTTEIGQKELTKWVCAYYSTVSKMMTKYEKVGSV